MIIFSNVTLSRVIIIIDILESHQKYLGFAWEIDGKLRFFVFTVLVFGLSTAPFLFTKLITVLIKHWRSLAIRIFAFIDDILGGGRCMMMQFLMMQLPYQILSKVSLRKVDLS